MHNIHDPANLLALCTQCHWAFDAKEWTFLPKNMERMIADIEANRDPISSINQLRDIEFQRWKLADEESDLESSAGNDLHYDSAFAREPIKIWPGAVGAVILSNVAILREDRDESAASNVADLTKAFKSFRKLFDIWNGYHNPCSNLHCTLCRPEKDDPDNNNGDDVDDDNDSDEDDDGDKNDEGDDDESDKVDDEDEDDGNDHEEKEKEEENQGVDEPLKKRLRRKRDAWEKSAPYDMSVPFSHRKGYTWYDTTSNELMAMWQGLPYIKNANGSITLINSSQLSQSVPSISYEADLTNSSKTC